MVDDPVKLGREQEKFVDRGGLNVHQSEILLLREIHVHAHVVIWPLGREQVIYQWFQPPRLGKEQVRENGLERGGVRCFRILA